MEETEGRVTHDRGRGGPGGSGVRVVAREEQADVEEVGNVTKRGTLLCDGKQHRGQHSGKIHHHAGIDNMGHGRNDDTHEDETSGSIEGGEMDDVDEGRVSIGRVLMNQGKVDSS